MVVYVINGTTSDVQSITGKLSDIESLRGKLSNVTNGLRGTLTVPEHLSDYPEYKGEVEITPDAHEDIVLDTADTTLKSDITVFKIPTYETSNEFGTTFIIGG